MTRSRSRCSSWPGSPTCRGTRTCARSTTSAWTPRPCRCSGAMRADDGTPRVCDDVWISYLSSEGERHGRLTAGFGADENKIGPEFTFGIYVQKLLDEPILIIKTAWGGKSLHTDFRPPSAGPYEFNEAQLERLRQAGEGRRGRQGREGRGDRALLPPDDRPREEGPGGHRAGLSRATTAARGYELAGFVWFQGWNDMVDRGTYPERRQAGRLRPATAALLDAPHSRRPQGPLGAEAALRHRRHGRRRPRRDATRREQRRYKEVHRELPQGHGRARRPARVRGQRRRRPDRGVLGRGAGRAAVDGTRGSSRR